jgi:hypothetical protein
MGGVVVWAMLGLGWQQNAFSIAADVQLLDFSC